MESPAHIDRNTQLQRIAEKEAEKEAASWPQRKPLSDAVEQWLVGMKKPGKSSINAYRSTMRKLLRWAKREGFECVSDVTPGALDAWVGSWAPDAPEKFNRLALTSQAALLKRIKAFFRWACSMKFTAENPTLTITAITTNESQTWPLTPAQFDELMTATYRYDDAAPKESARVGAWLRAIFLVQRWTGLRIGDVVTLPRTALVGNRLSVTIHKKRNVKPKRDNPVPSHMVCVLPDVAVEALLSLPTRREEQDYFFWNHKSLAETNANAWCAKIQKLNRYLSFVDESGQPMPFHSHMLRDMFAVENLKAGVPLEKVSKLLTHESVTITEQYYARWTKGRMQQLEDEAIAAMRRMGAVVTI
jgi:site-specific recombinase XerD